MPDDSPAPAPISPERCPKCRGRMNVYTTRRTPTKTVRTRQCERPGCGHRTRTEEKVVSANAPARRTPPRPGTTT